MVKEVNVVASNVLCCHKMLCISKIMSIFAGGLRPQIGDYFSDIKINNMRLFFLSDSHLEYKRRLQYDIFPPEPCYRAGVTPMFNKPSDDIHHSHIDFSELQRDI